MADKPTVNTAGTQLFTLDKVTDPAIPAVLKFNCATGISAIGDSADQIEDTCLEDKVRSYKRGLMTPGQLTVPFNLIPATHSQKLLFVLKDKAMILPWIIGLSDGETLPTWDDTAKKWVPPTDRTCISFTGYISSLELDISLNEIIRGTLTIQRDSIITPHWKTSYP